MSRVVISPNLSMLCKRHSFLLSFRSLRVLRSFLALRVSPRSGLLNKGRTIVLGYTRISASLNATLARSSAAMSVRFGPGSVWRQTIPRKPGLVPTFPSPSTTIKSPGETVSATVLNSRSRGRAVGRSGSMKLRIDTPKVCSFRWPGAQSSAFGRPWLPDDSATDCFMFC